MVESIHKFLNPPILETVLGVQFQPLPSMQNAHLGAFWNRIAADWPNITEQPPIELQFERFDAGGTWRRSQFQLALTQAPPLRLQMKNCSNDRMIQVQNGRLHYNWLRKGDGQEYPHYQTIRPEFENALESFSEFVQAKQLGNVEANQWEVTYVNHLPQGTVWAVPADWARLFPSIAMPAHAPSNLSLESFGGEWHYVIPGQKGRVHVQLRHGLADKEQVLVLTLTARGPVSAEVPLTVGLDVGREAIVRAFKDLTSETAHQFWRYTP